MHETVIQAENITKRYRIGRTRESYGTLRDSIAAFRPRLRSGQPNQDEEFWALRDVTFSVEQGDVLGIVGRNGAGKSTLLKILSRITEPTSGRAEIRGRLASLLEVGTGFHPELTGRENVFLNGAILGMTRAEVRRKFDEIVEFAEIQQFLDTPVKRYSSGMYVRLAFAVAAHLEPEILIVDEVLAVGDAAFQRKCLGKLGGVAKEGRTVLFVTHNMSAVQALCNKGILLSAGRVRSTGTASEIVQEYLQTGVQRTGEASFDNETHRSGNGLARFSRARVLDQHGDVVQAVPMGASITVEMEFIIEQQVSRPVFGVILTSILNERIARWRTHETHGDMPAAKNGGVVRVCIGDLNLLPGVYRLSLSVSDGTHMFDLVHDALEFEISPRQVYEEELPPLATDALIYTPCSWNHDYS